VSKIAEQYKDLSWEDANRLYESKRQSYTTKEDWEALKIICHKKSMDLVKSGLVPTLAEFYASGAGDDPDYNFD